MERLQTIILSLLLACCIFLNGNMVVADPLVSEPYLGPYTDVYPYVDIRQDQLSCSASTNGTCPLYIALMVSFGGEFNSSGVIPGVQLALDQINSDATMLPGYTLHYTLKETVCESHGTVALDALHTELLQPPTKLGVIGSGCSLATEPTAQVSHYYNVTHLSCASSSTSLADRERFRYYFQLLATEADLSIGFYSIIRKFSWSRVAIILQEESLFEVTMDHLQQLLQPSGVDVEVFRFSTRNGISDLGKQPFDPEYRIFLFAMYAPHARRLLCEAAMRGIQYPRYEFLFYGWYADNWWAEEEEELQSLYNGSCSVADRERVIGPALSPLQNEFISNCSSYTNSGINGFQFQRRYEEILDMSATSRLKLNEQSIYAQQCYDATWTLARALNNTLNDINNSSHLSESLKEFEADLHLPSSDDFGLQHVSYNNSRLVDVVYGHLNNTQFTGITGEVFFNTSTGVRIVPKTIIYQYRTSNASECTSCSCSKTPQQKSTIRREIIAEVNINDLNFNLLIEEDSLWTDGVPYDGEPEERIVSVHVALTGIGFVLAITGIAFAIFCIIFNFKYRDRKLIRLSSPNLNYLIGAGAIVLYVDVCFYVVPTVDQVAATVFCNLTPWLTAIGYSLCYGTIVAKMFRVFYIFRNPTAKKRRVQDWMLVLAVVVFVVLDVVILLVYTIVEGARNNLSAELVINEENRQAEVGPTGIILRFFFYLCDSRSRDIALGVLYGYKAVLQIAALVFSFSIRKVKVKGVNDAKYIAAAIYVTSIVTAVIFVSLYSLKMFINLYAALFALGFFIGTTVILVLVFVPKMISLHRDPEGEKVFSKTSPSMSHVSMQANKEALKENERVIETLRSRVKELETSLQQDGKSYLKGESDSGIDERKSSVTFSESKTLVIKNGHRSYTSSIDGNLDNIANDNAQVQL